MNVLLIALGVLLLVVLLAAFSYNRFVTQKNLIANSWSNIDTELRRRYDLIPNLVETVKGYAAHERAVLEEVTRARADAAAATGSPGTQERREVEVVRSLRRLLALSEAYPQLHADEHFLDLQRELALTEDRIQAARRFYNANVQDYNRRVASVPSNLVAGTFGFKRAEFFHIDEAIRPEVAAAPDIELGRDG
jgi:LemA protein